MYFNIVLHTYLIHLCTYLLTFTANTHNGTTIKYCGIFHSTMA